MTYEEMKAKRAARRAAQVDTRVSMPDYPMVDRNDSRIAAAAQAVNAVWDADMLCYIVPSTDRSVVAVLSGAVATVAAEMRAASEAASASRRARSDRKRETANGEMFGIGIDAIDR